MHLQLLSHARSRRILTAALLVIFAIIVIHILIKCLAFAHLFGLFGPHAGIRTTQLEIASAHNSSERDPRTPVVPKILHQIFHNWKDPGNATLPPHWELARQSCFALNTEWEFKLWTTESSRTFIEDEFSWFLPTYDGYKFPIQRVDVLRYFLLRRYGGMYLDLDNGCAANLDALTYYPAFTTDGDQGALSNNIMGGQPDHPYFQLLSETLIPYNWNWLLPYVIISYTSGQWFVTAMWEKYHSLLGGDGTVRGFEEAGTKFGPLHRILMDERPGADPWVFFTQTRGGTWTNWDSSYFAWVGDHILWIILGVCTLIGLCIWGCVRCARRKRSTGYQALPRTELQTLERI
ncbi:putative mannosyl phosphorylinositol ceramide synthase CSH1 [Xylariales sp. AK1849]|nr:putative mannosyl phosphorylinositol ceramide synthase CSH1 [Xylariales sp. AK1849]